MRNSFMKPTTWFLIFALGFAVTACSSPEERASAHFESGKQLLLSGEFVKAGLEFRNAIKLNEKLSDAWFGLANVEEQRQNWPAVADSLQRVLELDPKNFEAALKLAKLQLAAVKLDQALKNVNIANALKKDDTDALALRAAILFRLRDREGARADAEKSLAINHDNPDAFAVLAADQMADNNTVAALQFIDRGLKGDPKNLGLLLFKVKIFESSNDDPKLEEVLRTLTAGYPENREMKQALLSFLASRNRMPEVETELRTMVAANPNDTSQALDLVRLVSSLRGSAEAHKELEKLIAANPDKATYQLALAELDFTEKRTDIAVKNINTIIAKGEPKEDVHRAQLLLAEIVRQQGKMDEAKSLINAVLDSDAKNADAMAMRANIGLQTNDVESAVSDLREALNQQPQSIKFLMMLSQAYEQQGSIELAVDRFAEAVKVSKYEPSVTLRFIDLLERRGKRDQVEVVLNDAVNRYPNDPGLLTALAKIKLTKQDWVGAEKIAEALKKSDSKSAMVQQITAAAQIGQKKYGESIETLKQAYAAEPQTSDAMNSLVFAYLQADKIDEAESFVQSVLAANPKNGDALALAGSLKMAQKQPAEAEAAFKLAIERQPTNPVGYSALAKLYITQKKNDDAEALLLQGQSKAPGSLDLNLTLASLLELKNDIDGAIKVYEEQLKVTPDAYIMVNNLASLLADNRTDPESLTRAYQLAQRLASVDVPQFKDTLGWVAYQKNDYVVAKKMLEEAVEKLPNLAVVRYHLGMTYMALKRNADAKEQFSKASELLADGNPLKQKIATASSSLAASN
jgi:cellulose synthase operon protein C